MPTNLPRYVDCRWSPARLALEERRDQIIAAYTAGATIRDIADQHTDVGATRGIVHALLRRAKVQLRPSPGHAARVARRAATSEQAGRWLAQALQELRHEAGNPTYRQLGHDAHMTYAAAHQIIRHGNTQAAGWEGFVRLVRVMHGDPEYYRDLWEQTRDPKWLARTTDADMAEAS